MSCRVDKTLTFDQSVRVPPTTFVTPLSPCETAIPIANEVVTLVIYLAIGSRYV